MSFRRITPAGAVSIYLRGYSVRRIARALSDARYHCTEERARKLLLLGAAQLLKKERDA